MTLHRLLVLTSFAVAAPASASPASHVEGTTEQAVQEADIVVIARASKRIEGTKDSAFVRDEYKVVEVIAGRLVERVILVDSCSDLRSVNPCAPQGDTGFDAAGKPTTKPVALFLYAKSKSLIDGAGVYNAINTYELFSSPKPRSIAIAKKLGERLAVHARTK